jgi:hypothetical protein
MRGHFVALVAVAAALTLPALAHAAPPANDSYTTPEAISGATGTVFGTRAEATAEDAETPSMPHYHSIWYAWTSPGYGTVSFDTAGTAWAWVFEDGRLETQSMMINGQRYGFFNVKAGVTYLVGLDDWTDGGPTQFGWSYTETPPPPANDDWTSPQPLEGASDTVALDTRGATRQSCDGDLGYGYSVWYSWVAPDSGELTIQAITDTRGTIAGVYTYDGSTPCAVQIARSGGDPGVANVVAGQRYLFGVDTWGDTGGPTSFTYAFATVERPVNDDFANATPLGSQHRGSVSGSALHATQEPGEPPLGPKTVWYAWTPDVSGVASVDFKLGDGAVYTGKSLDSLQTVAYGGGRFDVTGGTTYFLQVGSPGDYSVDWLLEPDAPPANDLFANAQSIKGDTGYVESTNRLATFQSGEPNHGGTSTASVWFSWTAPADGNMVFWVDSSSWTVVQAYVGAKLTALSPAPGELQEPEAQRVSFPAVAGTIYRLAVDSRGGGTGVFWLGWLTDTRAPAGGAQPDTFPTDEDTPLTLTPDELTANDASADGGPVSFQNASTDEEGHGTLTFDDSGNLIFTPDANFTGDAHFSYSVIDDTGVETTATVTVQVAPVNDAPRVTLAVEAASIAEGGATSLTATATDVDGDKLTYSWSASAGTLSDSDSSATLSVDDGPAVSTVQVTVSDGTDSAIASQDVVVTNVAPTVTLKAVAGAWGVQLPFAATISDPSAADRAAGLSPTWFFDGAPVPGARTTHAFDAPGSYRVTFTATDKDGALTTRPLTVKVLRRNSTLAYAGAASAPFGFATVAATLGDALDPATARLDGHALSFTAGGVSFAATTSGGTGTVGIGGALLPGTYTVDAAFRGDALYAASSASGSLKVVNSAGKATGAATLSNGVPVSFSVRGDGAAVTGTFAAGSFTAASVTALGISGHAAWFAGTGTDGRPFVASVDDAAEPGAGADAARIWIDGALQPGSGTIAAGNVQLHK